MVVYGSEGVDEIRQFSVFEMMYLRKICGIRRNDKSEKLAFKRGAGIK